MQLNLNLLENSYDFLDNSLYYYNLANLDEGHELEQADIETKKKWKTSFIFLFQALELLLKAVLSKINPILVYENIDIPINESSKTVSFQKSVQRITNLKPNLLSYEQIQFILKCGDTRNQYTHYKVEYNSILIKKKFCKMIELYEYIHKEIIDSDIFITETNRFFYNDALKKANDFYVYRGIEFTKKEMEDFKKEILDNSMYNYYYDENNTLYPRIKWGDETDFLIKEKNYPNEYIHFDENRTYCPDCIAKRGEYHMNLCDIEVCPKCGQQLITCGCIKGMCHIEKDNKEVI